MKVVFMKKFLTVFFILIFALSASADENFSFIYINGSNNNNKKMRDWYVSGIKKLHPVLRKKFLNSDEFYNYFVKSGVLNIKEQPVIFFWGFNSKNDLGFVKKQLELSKHVSSLGAYFARNLITEFLHDAIWVQKQHNMIPILDELNVFVKNEAEKGNKSVIYGYSAGTFVTYEYFFNKLRFVNVYNLLKDLNADEDILILAKNNPVNNSCISALTDDYSGIGTMSETGHLILNKNKFDLKSGYLKLNKITEYACAPDGAVKGAVNYASPLPLFYSDISDEKSEVGYYNKLLVKYILENDIFFLTVNFREDPLGFPSSKNLTNEELEARTGQTVNNPSGIIYDNSGVWSGRSFAFAHTSYWNARKIFSSAIVKSLVDGYKFSYEDDCLNN